MKKITLLFSLILIINSCDVEEGPFITDYDSYINPDKKVLIEDFTGHKCPNCPNAAREIESIHDLYGDQIIAMAIHVSGFAKPNILGNEFTYDFRTKWGDDLNNQYNPAGNEGPGLPSGMINRVSYSSGLILNPEEWASTVSLELKKDIDCKISISSDTNLISVTTEIVKNITANYNIVVCLTENNIINWQEDGALILPDYEHNHVLRSVITDESLSNNNLFTGEIIENSYEINLGELMQYNIDYSKNTADDGNGEAGGWVTENMSVIAYVYNTSTGEIVQVEEVHLISN